MNSHLSANRRLYASCSLSVDFYPTTTSHGSTHFSKEQPLKVRLSSKISERKWAWRHAVLSGAPLTVDPTLAGMHEGIGSMAKARCSWLLRINRRNLKVKFLFWSMPRRQFSCEFVRVRANNRLTCCQLLTKRSRFSTKLKMYFLKTVNFAIMMLTKCRNFRSTNGFNAHVEMFCWWGRNKTDFRYLVKFWPKE